MSKENIIKTFEKITDNARYTAESHHIIATRSKMISRFTELFPAVIASLSSAAFIQGFIEPWSGLLALISSVIVATSIVINPNKSYYENLNAAKNFTVIKNKASRLKSLSSSYSENDLLKKAEKVSEEYEQLVRLTPPTTDWAYEKAKEKLG
ncbi:MAG: SLATT domain-containing protein [Candidatus Paceibacterota bacterium]